MTALTAYDCFTTANDLFARGHYLDAQTLYDRACRLEPDNTVFAERFCSQCGNDGAILSARNTDDGIAAFAVCG